ncbi:hypothetical protein COLSTE_02286 [Collinsella stercoris DSM 13279]|uniref:Uncharacterized protein n=1 Tax=Collinsella stercoris DSM 13279 TaxID=445975 RepID=B6GDV0_9ACTN|nr:hypothetical protein COLSTE_02286 [Collinsella stercoris DSM 13279]
MHLFALHLPLLSNRHARKNVHPNGSLAGSPTNNPCHTAGPRRALSGQARNRQHQHTVIALIRIPSGRQHLCLTGITFCLLTPTDRPIVEISTVQLQHF